ncbi:hypothetical protein BAC3_00015 [uncultured bacterium]|nr:hypothetical protein BAC3_00015 [uncultured bacterium]
MKEKEIVKTQLVKTVPSQERRLVLKVVKIEKNQPCEDLHSNSCDNCHPWTSCCDSY